MSVVVDANIVAALVLPLPYSGQSRAKNDFARQLAVERAFQAAIESCADIAAHSE